MLASEVNCDWRTTNNGPPPLLPATIARELSCVIPRVKSSGLTSFLYQGVDPYATGITYHLELSNASLKTLLNIKLSVFYIVVSLYRKAVYTYVLNDRVFFAFFFAYFIR